MSSTFERLTKSSSRSSRTSATTKTRPTSTLLGRASSFMPGNRRSQAASESQAAALDPNMGITATPQQSRGGLRPFRGIFPAPDASVKLSPPVALPQEQEAKFEQMLQHFRSVKEYPVSFASGAESKPLNDWETLRLLSRESMLRYLRATKWDVAQAKKRLTDTIIWRREYGVDSLDPQQLEPEAETGKESILGFDNKGRPLHYMHPSRNTTDETPRQMQFAVWVLESAIDLMPPGVEQLALLINFGGKKRNPTSISNAKLMLYILQNHYVERLGVALCINVPWIFKAFWNAIYPFIDPVTKSKCKFDEAIKKEVPASQLAADFGGEVDFEYDHAKYWPDLVSLVQQRREQQLRRFREDCHSQIGASEWVIRGGDEADPRTALKKDSAFAESPELVAAAAEAQNATASGSAVTASLLRVPKEVTYRPVREDGTVENDDDDDADSTLDRFVTSREELPEDPLNGDASENLSHLGSDSETTAVVHETQPSSQKTTAVHEAQPSSEKSAIIQETRAYTESSKKRHPFGSLFHIHHKDDSKNSVKSRNSLRSATKNGAKGGDDKHNGKSLFTAVVGGVSAGSVGGAAAVKAADQSWPKAKVSSDEHNHVSSPLASLSSLNEPDARNAVQAM